MELDLCENDRRERSVGRGRGVMGKQRGKQRRGKERNDVGGKKDPESPAIIFILDEIRVLHPATDLIPTFSPLVAISTFIITDLLQAESFPKHKVHAQKRYGTLKCNSTTFHFPSAPLCLVCFF